jgi:hypothetical protein
MLCNSLAERQLLREVFMGRPALARRSNAVLLASIAVGLSACDIPTEAPVFEPRFVVDAVSTAFSVTQLLPASITAQGSAFQVTLTAAPVTRTLGEICPACIPFNGQTVPKPAFTAILPTASFTLANEVRSIVLNGSTLNVQFFNGFSFDPIRPSANPAVRGSIAVRIAAGATVLADTTISGTTLALPPDQTTTVPIALRPGTVSNTGPVGVDVTITSPQGDNTQINTNAQFRLTPLNATVNSANVSVTNRRITAPQVTLDLSDISHGLIQRVKSGGLIVSLSNPFSVTGNLTVTFTGATIPSKIVQIAPGTTTQTIPFSQTELRQLLGHTVIMAISGPVNATVAATGVTVTPNQAVTVITRLDLKLTTANTN